MYDTRYIPWKIAIREELPMNRMLKLSALTLLALSATTIVAAEPAPAKPAGVRVGYTLILFGCEDAVVKAMGIEGQKTLNGPYLGTWHDIKGAKAMDQKRMVALERGDFDSSKRRARSAIHAAGGATSRSHAVRHL
jgi:hypothetical protein